jgi:monoamine oxidase
MNGSHRVLSLLLTLLLPGTAASVEPSTDHDVVIVGAGAAGLYAAYTLDNLGYDVLVVEASDRHGGRVYSSSLGDMHIELGAEELYAAQNNFVFDDIKAQYGNNAQREIYAGGGTQDHLHSMDGGSTCWVYTGNCDLDPDISDYWDFYYDVSSHENDSTDELISDVMDTDWGVTSSSRGYHLYEGGYPGGDFGTTVTRMGMRSLARQEALWPLAGTLYGLDPTGYLDALNTLYFNQVVGKVTLNSPVTVIDTSGPKPVAIDANGVYHYANAILVTVSVGVLQAEMIDFVPDLPASKVTAYNTLGMGKGMKLALRFSSTFWNGSKMFSLLTEGPTGLCWAPGKYQTGTTNDVLMCFSMGLNAEFMSGLADDTARLNQALADLDAMFSGQATTNFVEGVVQDWTNEPYVRGSYSYPAPGTYPNGGPSMREELAEPVGSDLFFAGEATHNTTPSTVPGALQSGERAAGEIDTGLGGPPAVNAPTADFQATPDSGGAGVQVTFTDTSSNTPTSWSWDFGDTGSSTNQNPVHQYASAGTYTVSLTATNANGSHTRVMPNLIAIPEPAQSIQLAAGILGLVVLNYRHRLRGRPEPPSPSRPIDRSESA